MQKQWKETRDRRITLISCFESSVFFVRNHVSFAFFFGLNSDEERIILSRSLKLRQHTLALEK